MEPGPGSGQVHTCCEDQEYLLSILLSYVWTLHHEPLKICSDVRGCADMWHDISISRPWSPVDGDESWLVAVSPQLRPPTCQLHSAQPPLIRNWFLARPLLSRGKNLIMVKRSDYPHQPRPPHARLVMGGDSILININFTALHIEFLWHHSC